MRGALTLALTLVFLCCRCQEVAYKQFTVKDGLPGSIVYQSLQDRHGFIWFATNQGVSRFDGRTFKNFSKEDGLPDNDILKLYLDSHDNVWFVSLLGIPSVWHDNIITRFDSFTAIRSICENYTSDSIVFVKADFNNDACGYYQSPNTPGAWHFTPHMRGILTAGGLNVLRNSCPGQLNVSFGWVNDTTQYVTLQSRDALRAYPVRADFRSSALAFGLPQYSCINSRRDGVYFFTTDSLYFADMHHIYRVLPLKELGVNQVVRADVNYIFNDDDSTLWICTRGKGLLCLKDPLGPRRSVIPYFDASFCTSIVKDGEKGYWITTHSDGVFYMSNPSFHSISGSSVETGKSVRCIHRLNNGSIAAGFSDGNIMIISPPSYKAGIIPSWDHGNKNNRVLDIGSFGSQYLLTATDAGLFRVSPAGMYKRIMTIASIKQFFIADDSTIINATSNGIVKCYNNGRHKAEHLLARATCVTGWNDAHFYWGTLQGMYVCRHDSVLLLGKKFPVLSGVINHIDIAPDSAIWVSTGQGIAILKNDRVRLITKEQGLPSNLCKHVSFDGSTCWVSTDKGISRIAYRWQDGELYYSLSNITEEDGLTANDVNQTAAAGNYIWAATGRGISFFSKDYISRSDWKPLINITRIVANDSTLPAKDTIFLGAQKTRLLIELSGISFRSGKEISYEYRLKEIDSSWRHIVNNNIEFFTLPFGSYALEVRAIDRWGNRSSRSTSVFISHPPPVWLRGWFILSSYLLMAFAAGAAVYAYHRYRRRKREDDYQLKKRMQDLEMMALRAQMNPHFIFNCLTSIQSLIIKADAKSASSYLHKFSTLIRQTLQNSTATTILLRDEIRLLELYLDLEKLRLGERMEYRIDISPGLNPDQQMIPSMIIQPYVENAVKHGVGPLEGVKGLVLLSFKKTDRYVECFIDDNGRGIDTRPDAGALHESHRSMGASITEKRIHTLNALQKEKIRMLVIDKHRSGYAGSGTLIQLYFPISNS